MKPEDEILTALRALADADRELEAPPEVELRLRAQFRTSAARRRHRASLWVACAVAAALILAIAFSRHPRPGPARTQIPVRQIAPRPIDQPAPVAETAVNPPRRASHHDQSREIVTDFFPLMDDPPPLDHGELVRVSLPAAAMRTVGLPVREDRLSEPVQADVLVSEDGLATAIRFIKTQP